MSLGVLKKIPLKWIRIQNPSRIKNQLTSFLTLRDILAEPVKKLTSCPEPPTLTGFYTTQLMNHYLGVSYLYTINPFETFKSIVYLPTFWV